MMISVVLFALAASPVAIPESVQERAPRQIHFQLAEQLDSKSVLYFDFGGVVAQPDGQAQLNYLVDTLGFSAEALSDSPYFCWMQLHSKEIEYLKQKSSEYHIDLTDEGLASYSNVKRSSVRAVPGMSELIADLRQAGYEVNLVTNVRAENLDLIEPFRSLFNRVVHCPKHPGERQEAWEVEWAFHTMDPSQFLLIDDQEPNVLEARQLGMESIQFVNIESLREQFIKHGILGS